MIQVMKVMIIIINVNSIANIVKKFHKLKNQKKN